MTKGPQTYVCVGKDCRRDKCHKDLLAVLDACSDVKRVRCQDICKGPVAGVLVDGHVLWFKRIRKPRHRKALVAYARRGRRKVPGLLQDRWEPKRTDKLKR